MSFPWGGNLAWAYQSFAYAGGRTLREVGTRYVAADSAGSVVWTYPITRPDAGNTVTTHSGMTLTDASGNGAKKWSFLTTQNAGASWQVGLVSDFRQLAAANSANAITHDTYTWSQDAAGNPYISAKTSVSDEGTGNQQSALTTQTLDQYGNATQAVVYPYNYTARSKEARGRYSKPHPRTTASAANTPAPTTARSSAGKTAKKSSTPAPR